MNFTVFTSGVGDGVECKVWDPVLRVWGTAEAYDYLIFCMIVCDESCGTGESAHQESYISDFIIFEIVAGDLATPTLQTFPLTVWGNSQNSIIPWCTNIIFTPVHHLTIISYVESLSKIKDQD